MELREKEINERPARRLKEGRSRQCFCVRCCVGAPRWRAALSLADYSGVRPRRVYSCAALWLEPVEQL